MDCGSIKLGGAHCKMKRIILVAALVFGHCVSSFAQSPTISPRYPAVKQGSTIAFKCVSKCGTGGTWSCSGCAGSINSSTGIYTAPSAVEAQQSIAGMQLLPNNHIYNTNIASLPECTVADCGATSVTLMSETPSTTNFFWNVNWPFNYLLSINGTTPMVYKYTSNQNGNYYMPTFPTGRSETGWLSTHGCASCNAGSAIAAFDPFSSSNDHHIVSIIADIGVAQENYGYYLAGTNPACRACTSQSGILYSLNQYTLPPGHMGDNWGTSDAAGMMIIPPTLRLQEWEWAVIKGGSIKHALRMTMNTSGVSTGLWPSTGYSAPHGALFFGMRYRLKSSYNVSGFTSSACFGSTASTCLAAAKVLLYNFQNYGIFLTDGGGNWNVTIEYTPLPLPYRNALRAVQDALTSGTIPKSDWDVVDETSLMISPLSGETTQNREIVRYTASSGSASTDVVLVGPAVNFSSDRYYIQAGAPSETLQVLNNYGGFTCSGNAVGTLSTVSDGCQFTPPETLTSPQSFTLTATSSLTPSVGVVTTVVVLPSGVIRLVPGQYPQPDGGRGNYTDTSGNVWYSEDSSGYPTLSGDCATTWDETPVPCWGYPQGHWGNSPNIYLYEVPMGGYNDLRFDIWVPNGAYTIDGKFGNAQSGDEGNMAVEAQGVDQLVDIYKIAGGANKPYDVVSKVTVTNNILSYVIRRDKNAFISAFSITRIHAP